MRYMIKRVDNNEEVSHWFDQEDTITLLKTFLSATAKGISETGISPVTSGLLARHLTKPAVYVETKDGQKIVENSITGLIEAVKKCQEAI